MTDDIISLNSSAVAIRRIVGSDPDRYAALLTLAAAGQIPATRTKTGGFLISRRDLPLIAKIFKEFVRN